MTYYWKNICTELEPFPCSTRVLLGNGKGCAFWTDTWHMDISLANRFPNLYDLSTQKREVVSKCGYYGTNGWSWSLNFSINLDGVVVEEYGN